MKKLICALLTLMLMTGTLTVFAAGQTEEEMFLAQCGWRLRRTAQGYEDAHMTVPSETVPIGTYCMITTDFGDVVRITFYAGGSYHRVCINRSDLIGAYTQYRTPDDTTHTVYTSDPDYEKKLEGNEITWLAESEQVDLDGQIARGEDSGLHGGASGGTASSGSGSTAGGSSSGSQSSGSSSGRPSGSSASSGKTQPSDNTVRSPGGATGEGIGGVSVKVVTLGTRTSVVSMDGKQQELPTTELTFAPGIPDSHKVAYIYAPESGQCWLRKSPSESGTTIRKCSAGTVVAVLEVGDSFTKIRYRDDVGYVLTRCLVFCNPERGTIGTGMITLKGNGSGRADINVRNAPTREAVVVKSWKTGTLVEVFSYRDGWYEVEYNGVHAFVKEDYLTMQ